MLLEKSRFDYFYRSYSRKLYAEKSIPSLLHPFPITTGIHTAKVFWKGGFPSFEQEWNFPENWSTGKVPGAKDLVVISTHYAKNNQFPILSTSVNPIAQLEIKQGAELTISTFGRLIIDGTDVHSFGVINLGVLMNEGALNIQNTQQFCIHNLGLFVNENELCLDKTIEEGIRESEESSFLNCGEILEVLVR